LALPGELVVAAFEESPLELAGVEAGAGLVLPLVVAVLPEAADATVNVLTGARVLLAAVLPVEGVLGVPLPAAVLPEP
jgi:hypothetical protein